MASFPRAGELRSTLWAFRREALVVGVFSLVVNLLMLTPTLYMLQVYDRVLASQSELTLLAVSLIALFLFGVMAFAEWARSRLLVRAGVRLDEALSTRVFGACFEAQLERAGSSPAQAFSDLTNIRQFLTGNGIFAFFDAPWTPIYILVLALLHPLLGALALIFAGVSAATAWASHRLAGAPTQRADETAAEAGVYLTGKLRNSETIEALGMLGDLRRRWLAKHRRQLAAHGGAEDLSQRMTAISKFLRYSQQSLALGAGAWLVIEGQLTPGAMIAANVLTNRALAPIDLVVATWKSFLSARSAFGRLEALLARHPQRPAGAVHEPPRGRVRLEGLAATAPGRAEPILKGLTAEFPAGTVVAVVGPSGSGKSTLARCLVGVWPQTGGRVLLDEAPVESWERDELGPHIGYLPQDVELFEGTLAENIARFGEVDPAKVIEAAQRAGVHDMILRFPRGYDTPLGATNILSGGQRQRIALARAMYGNPALVVLDEPNANLDDAGEAALVRAVQDLKGQGRTVVLITHRPGILGVADRVLVLREGAIQHFGPPAAVAAALRPQAAPGGPAAGAAPQPA